MDEGLKMLDVSEFERLRRSGSQDLTAERSQCLANHRHDDGVLFSVLSAPEQGPVKPGINAFGCAVGRGAGQSHCLHLSALYPRQLLRGSTDKAALSPLDGEAI